MSVTIQRCYTSLSVVESPLPHLGKSTQLLHFTTQQWNQQNYQQATKQRSEASAAVSNFKN